MPSAAQIIVHDVSLRDGIQSELVFLPLTNRLKIIERLITAGVKNIQVASFVHPKRVPQMKDIEQFVALLPQIDDVSYSGLVLNEKGLERLKNTRLDQVDISLSCSETHSMRNTGLSTDAARQQALAMIATAKKSGLSVRAGLQCVFGCAYEGRISSDVVINLTRDLIAAGADSISWADSTGQAIPSDLKRMTQLYFTLFDRPLIYHLHDTRGLAMANFIEAFHAGAREFDAALGGSGACPFIPGAAGNIAMEDMIAYCDRLGITSGIDVKELIPATILLESSLNQALPGRVYQLEKKLSQVQRTDASLMGHAT